MEKKTNQLQKKLKNELVNKMHVLKISPQYFEDVCFGKKNFEVRINDRGYKVGDRLMLFEYPSIKKRYTFRTVQYVLLGGQYGIEKDYVVLGLQPRKI